ncbi:MAG: amidohydrolase family protein [Alphaproteobacteria bacterium]|nr:amidohydrolase family protein [Alphaproteobacteria bacterium]
MHDLLIRNAVVHDGTGAPGRSGALAVKDGRIAAIGEVDDAAREIVDASGLVLMPGIIDSHTHYDAQVTWDPWLTPSSSLGVTTAIIGNCGFTIAPCRPADRERTMRNLTQVEGMSLEVLRNGIAWNFETFPEYLDMLERGGTVLNLAAFLGHSSLRTWIMGAAATERAATAAEVAEMAALVRAAMKIGAVGFATSTAPQHNGEGGTPMPSRLADSTELSTLVNAMGESGRGVFMLTKGGGTSVAYLESIAAASGRPVMIAALLHNSTNPRGTFDELDAIAAAQLRGHRLYGQVSCCPLTNDFTLRSAYPLEGFAAWRPAMRARGADLKRILADPSFRQAVKDELRQPAGVRLFNGEWHKIEVVETARPENRAVENCTVDRLAADAGQHPLDWMLDFAIAEDLGTVFTAVLLNSDEDAVGRMLRHPHASIALSDAGAHLTFFCDAGFGLHLMGHWVRERGVLSLEEAIWQLTGRPAEIFGIPGRGVLRPGAAADLLLIDPATVGRGPKRRVFDLPGGAPRLTTDARGVHGVWVNGVRVADASGPIAAAGRPGKLLRDFAIAS